MIQSLLNSTASQVTNAVGKESYDTELSVNTEGVVSRRCPTCGTILTKRRTKKGEKFCSLHSK
jgi:hypothetical protein